MKLSRVEISDLTDSWIEEDYDQDILAHMSTDLFINILDSFAPRNSIVESVSFKISQTDLTGATVITFIHTLNTMNLKAVLYSHENKRVGKPNFDIKPLTNSSVQITIFSSIPYGKFYRGYFYKIA